MQEKQKTKLRLVRLMEQPFRVHPEEAFDDPIMDAIIMSPMPNHEAFLRKREEIRETQCDVLPELRMFYQEPLLTREQEYHLFRQYNYLKHKAKQILQNADLSEPSAEDVEKVENCLKQASLVKRQLAGSNVRLVMHLAKKQKDYLQNQNIDLLAEIVSDGYMGLIKSVDYFDYRLGNKFSTYASWAIIDTMQRARKMRIKHSICSNGMEDTLARIIDGTNGEQEYDFIEEKVSVIESLRQLPTRQRQVIVEFFGLDGKGHRKLKEIGESVGLTKERVRQLREAGIAKLRHLLK